jgi:hypothetical protein
MQRLVHPSRVLSSMHRGPALDWPALQSAVRRETLSRKMKGNAAHASILHQYFPHNGLVKLAWLTDRVSIQFASDLALQLNLALHMYRAKYLGQQGRDSRLRVTTPSKCFLDDKPKRNPFSSPFYSQRHGSSKTSPPHYAVDAGPRIQDSAPFEYCSRSTLERLVVHILDMHSSLPAGTSRVPPLFRAGAQCGVTV